MNATQVKVTAVEPKEGVSQKTGKPWRKFIVHTEGGAKFDTFDAALANAATGAVGQFAAVTYETTQFGNDLKSLIVQPNGAAPPEMVAPAPAAYSAPPPSQDGPDWERIGRQKTRCALWAALFSSGTLSGMPEIAALTLGVGLVRGAEVDIFTRDFAQAGDEIPF